jgi:PIN domain nuclease of toxin-antitoxin system
MSYLIDTQILIWTLINPKKLIEQTKQILQNNEIFVSHICLFEIAIKQKIGKLPELDMAIATLCDLIKQDGFTLLELKTKHIAAYTDIPLLPEHRDPFDRLLLATAFSENMPIISADENFVYYQPQIQLIANK